MLLISEPEAVTIFTIRYLTEEMGRNFLKASYYSNPRKVLIGAYTVNRLVRVSCYVRLAEKLWYVTHVS